MSLPLPRWDGVVETPSRSRLTIARPSRAPSLAVLAFEVIEYKYRGGGDGAEQWYYAPQIRVVETSGLGSVRVITLEVSIPELGGAPSTVRFLGVRVRPGQSRELIGERFGEYEVAYFANGLRAARGTARALVTYVDQDGHSRAIRALGPVTPGAMPTTYTRGKSAIVPHWSR